MLIKKTYDDWGGHLYSFCIGLENSLVKSKTNPLAEKSLVKTKNGNSEGTRTLTQTSKPCKAMLEYLVGFIIMAKITNKIKIAK